MVPPLRDQFLRCTECGTEFVYTVSEQRAAQCPDRPLLCPACRALERRLAKGPQVERTTDRRNGRVSWFDARRGYGFLVAETGERLFVHRSQLVDGSYGLRRGQEVSFLIRRGERGIEAMDVMRVAS
jgi:cold shock CspA family protein